MERLNEIQERLTQIVEECRNDDADLDLLTEERNKLVEERDEINKKIEKRKELLDGIISGEKATVVQRFEKRKEMNMTREDVLCSPEYRNAFFKALQSKPLTDEEKRAYDSGSASAGAVIPTQTGDQLFEKMKKLAPMLSEITLLRVSGNVTFAIENVRGDAYAHTENDAITYAVDTLTSVTLGGYEFNKIIRISKTVQTMAINAFEGWLVDILAEDIARKVENAIINGDGDGEPKGVASARTYTPTYEVSGSTDISFDNVMDLIAKLPAGYDRNAKFLCNKKFVYTQLAKIKETSTDAPILVKNMEDGLKFMLMGYPIIISDYVADDYLYLGDFKKVVGNLAQDITVDKSEHSGFAHNAVDYRGGAIFDSDIGVSEAFVRFVKNS